VRTGDSLQTIAQAAYGDSQLWYLIADASGLFHIQNSPQAQVNRAQAAIN
jgi:nucleoid-associated protein YgaU